MVPLIDPDSDPTIEAFKAFGLPLRKAPPPASALSSLIPVQPMPGPKGHVFYADLIRKPDPDKKNMNDIDS